MEETFIGYLTILETKFCHPRAIFLNGTLVLVCSVQPCLIKKLVFSL